VRSVNSAVISLGSNIGPRENIPKALALIKSRLSIVETASFIRTSPVGYTDQPDFINGAVLVETDMSRQRLRLLLKQFEKTLGRKRTSNKYGPRTIDLDIVVWNGSIVDSDVSQRDFLRQAVRELIPDIHIPG